MHRISPATDPKATHDWLDALLDEQARAAIGQGFVNEPLVLELHEGDRRLGGLSARFGTEWVFVEFLAVVPEARGRGVGRRLMARLEDEARRRGKIGIWLDSYSFQAPDFYRRLGFAECGRIDDYPTGHARHFFAKRLDLTGEEGT